MKSSSHPRAIPKRVVHVLVVTALICGLPGSWRAAVSAATGELFASPDGSGRNCTRTDPCRLRTALDIARTNDRDDVVTLAPGTYPDVGYAPDDGMALTVRSRPGALPGDVILDAGGSGTPFHLESIEAPGSVTIMGLTLQGGSWSGLEIFCESGSLNVLLDHVVIQNNAAVHEGGGIDIRAGLDYRGQGHGVVTVDIRDSTIRDNQAGRRGGAICVHSGRGDSRAELRISNTLIYRNRALWTGGGIDLSASELGDNNAAHAILVNSIITDNLADSEDDGRFTGGGVHAYAYSGLGAKVTLDLYNSIVYGNRLGGGAQQDLFLGEWGGDWGRGDTVVSAYYSDIGDILIDTERSTPEYRSHHVINADPAFRDPAAGNYRLLPTSPCIDRGTHAVPAPPGLPAADMDGEPRVSGAAPDIGAYEVQLESVYLPAVMSS